MAQLTPTVGTPGAPGRPAPVPKPEYMKLSPSSPHYAKVMSLAASRDCAWQDVVRDALTFYFEFQEKKVIILTAG